MIGRMKDAPRRGPGRPPLPATQRRRLIGLRLSPATIDGIRELAQLRGQSQADVLQVIVDRALKRERIKAGRT